MQFSTFALSAMSIGSALGTSPSNSSPNPQVGGESYLRKKDKTDFPLAASGMVTVHVVQVGAANGTLAYFPNNIKAAVGDMVQFQFAPANHTVTQSTFDQPCMPIAMNSNITGVYSGFMPTTATATTTPTYTIMINSTTPMWLYCSQGKHCQNGMTMVINENTAANSSRSLTNFAALAAKATVNLPGNAIADGTAGTTTSNSTSGTGSSSSSSSTTSSGAKSTSSSAAGMVRAGEAVGLSGLLAVGVALLL
ncbi:hypothetical protein EG329_012376 [Mollisiaceae sp. DMI_Dod_QoI]|nr:hypothetical protein EG329_012376 [Helotiales sp. DMI_Dod_QoI]